MPSRLSYIVTDSGTISLTVDRRPLPPVDRHHPNYEAIKAALARGDADALLRLADVAAAVRREAGRASGGLVTVEDGRVLYRGQPLHNTVTEKILQLHREGFPVDPTIRFLERVLENPSRRSVEQLYGYAQKHGVVLTEDGHLLFWKRVKEDWTDCHTGTINNQPFTPEEEAAAVAAGLPPWREVTVPRNQVDDDPRADCSFGLHCGTQAFVAGFTGERTLVVRVDPADVVSIPYDANCQKVRVCRYWVLYEYGDEPLPAPVYTPAGRPAEPPAPPVEWEGSTTPEPEPVPPPPTLRERLAGLTEEQLIEEMQWSRADERELQREWIRMKELGVTPLSYLDTLRERALRELTSAEHDEDDDEEYDSDVEYEDDDLEYEDDE